MESPPAIFRTSSVLISGSLGNTMSMSSPAVQQESCMATNNIFFKGTASADADCIYIYIPHWTRTKNDRTKRLKMIKYLVVIRWPFSSSHCCY